MSEVVLHQRPEVFGSDWGRFWSLVWTLAFTDWKLRFYGSVLGAAWTLARPFAFFGVLYVVFVEIAKLGEGIPHFPAYILVSMMLFLFWNEIVTGCVQCLVQRENLLRKIRFPRLVIPLSVALTALMNLGMTLLAVLPFLLITGVDPRLGWLALIPIIVLLFAFGLGLGLLLAALFVRFRDIAPIWDVASQMLFYLSPVLYVAVGDQIPSDWLQIYLCNPIASLFTEVRHSVMDPQAAGMFEAMGVKLLIPTAIVASTMVLGVWVFNREAPRVAENL